MDWEGNIVDRRYTENIFLSKIEKDVCVSESITIVSVENATIDNIIGEVA